MVIKSLIIDDGLTKDKLYQVVRYEEIHRRVTVKDDNGDAHSLSVFEYDVIE